MQLCEFPNSLREIHLELESLERRKNQIDKIASEMIEHWHFRKKDGSIMSASEQDCTVSRWSGSSTWEGRRWIRDETKPATNEYYVKTVKFKPNKEMTERPSPRRLFVPDSFPVLVGGITNVNASEIEQAGVAPDVPVQEMMYRVQAWRERRLLTEREREEERRRNRRESRRLRNQPPEET